VFTIIKITKIRLLLKYSWNIIKIQLHTYLLHGAESFLRS